MYTYSCLCELNESGCMGRTIHIIQQYPFQNTHIGRSKTNNNVIIKYIPLLMDPITVINCSRSWQRLFGAPYKES